MFRLAAQSRSRLTLIEIWKKVVSPTLRRGEAKSVRPKLDLHHIMHVGAFHKGQWSQIIKLTPNFYRFDRSVVEKGSEDYRRSVVRAGSCCGWG